MNAIGNFKFGLEEILELKNPLILSKSEGSLLSNITVENHQGLLSLNLKPTLKIDKKGKKLDKDEDRDLDRTASKLKVKKKIRSKVSFEEEYDVIAELNETSTSEPASALPLARPIKPINSIAAPVFTIKQKGSTGSIAKKKGQSNLSIKKLSTNQDPEKPTHVNVLQATSIEDLANIFNLSKTEIVKTLFLKGYNVTVNQVLDLNTIQKLGKDFDIEVTINPIIATPDIMRSPSKSEDNIDFKNRPPIVTVMGHVDHGKTTLLDRIRNTQVAKKEAGGITQKIGAYEVDIPYNGSIKKVTFLDTPGHAAFSGMRSRGVSITDLVILVVAADDGIKPQTIEAIEYSQSARVPLIIAVNKIDKEDADISRLQEELAKYNIISEEWGGDTLVIPISAMKGTNIDKLLEAIILTTDLLNLRSNPSGPVQGVVLESNLDRARGAVATAIIQTGTLRIGDTFIAGESMSKVRGLINSNGTPVREASLSSPVLIWGLSKVPAIGDVFHAFRTEKEAKTHLIMAKPAEKSNFSLSQQLSDLQGRTEDEQKEKLNLIIKTDTQGSAEAIKSSLSKIIVPRVSLRILYACAGEITETDIEFASTSNARLLAFNTTLASGTKKAANYSAVLIKEFNVIYDLFDYVEELITNLVGPEYEEKFLGTAIVKTIFPLAKSFVAGSSVIEGKITKTAFVHVLRDSQVLYKGKLDSLKKVKEDVLEVSQSFECGIYIAKFDSWKPGDLIQAFELVEKKIYILRPTKP